MPSGGSVRGYQDSFSLRGSNVARPAGDEPTVCLCVGTLRLTTLICRIQRARSCET